MHRRGEGVVGGLGLIDIIVGMKGLGIILKIPPTEHMSAMGDHLVDIHVTLRPTPSLPHHQWKLILHFALDDFIAGLSDTIGLGFGEDTAFHIGQRGGLFEVGKCEDDLFRHALTPNFKVFKGSLGLSAPIGMLRDTDLTHGVFFDTVGSVFCHFSVRLTV